MVFKPVIGRWFSLEDWPGFGVNDVLPPVNHQRMSWGLFAIACILLDTPSCEVSAFFHQKLAILSGPGSLQFFFFFITFLADVDSSVNSYFWGSLTLSLICISHFSQPRCRRVSTSFLFPGHNSFQNVLASLTVYHILCSLSPFWSISWSYFRDAAGTSCLAFLIPHFSSSVLVPFSVFLILTFDSHLQAHQQIAVCKLLIALLDFSFLSLSIYCLSLTFPSQPWRLMCSS